jgi:hypothetical protein
MNIIDLSNNFIECTICFYPVLNDKYVTDCSHTFHHICLYEWCQQKKICPLCTKDIEIKPFNQENTDNNEMELRSAGLVEPGLIDNIEFQRYLEYVERQRLSREQREFANSRIEETTPQRGSTIVIINDYNTLESDDEQSQNEQSQNDNMIVISTRERVKIRIYVFLEFTTTFALTSYILNKLQLLLLLLSTSTSISYKLRFNDMRFLSLVFKVIFISYSVVITQNIYYEQLFVLFPWIVLSIVK